MAATHATNRPPTTPPGLRGRNSWRGWGRSFRWSARGVVATSGSSSAAATAKRSPRGATSPTTTTSTTMAAGTACIATALPSTASATGLPTTSSITPHTSRSRSTAMITCWSSTRSIMCARSRTTRAPCTPAMHVDARGLGWAAFQRETLMQRLADMPWQEEPWKSRYPELSGLGKWDEIEATATPSSRSATICWASIRRLLGRRRRNFRLRVRHELPRRGRQRRAGDLDDQRRGERRFGEPPPDSLSPPRLPSRSAAGRPLPKCL